MRKSNLVTLLMFVIMSLAVATFASCSQSNREMYEPETSNPRIEITPEVTAATETMIHDTEEPSSTEQPLPTEMTEPAGTEPADMNDTLFIGDSRTVGIMEYAGIANADFFCGTGMSVFSVREDRVSVPTVGKVTLDELLTNKKYGKVYIMLGINELGYNFESIIDKYGELLEYVESCQPDAVILIQANLHISKKRSECDRVINNDAINKLNLKLSEFADNERIFYMDVNPLFDDADGSLSADKAYDDAHLYAKYYVQWGEWICRETTAVMMER